MRACGRARALVHAGGRAGGRAEGRKGVGSGRKSGRVGGRATLPVRVRARAAHARDLPELLNVMTLRAELGRDARVGLPRTIARNHFDLHIGVESSKNEHGQAVKVKGRDMESAGISEHGERRCSGLRTRRGGMQVLVLVGHTDELRITSRAVCTAARSRARATARFAGLPIPSWAGTPRSRALVPAHAGKNGKGYTGGGDGMDCACAASGQERASQGARGVRRELRKKNGGPLAT